MLFQLYYCLITVAKKNGLKVVFSVEILEVAIAIAVRDLLQSSSALTEEIDNTVTAGIYDIDDSVMDTPNHLTQ